MSSTLSANDYSTEPFDKWGNFYGFRTENGPDALSVSPETEKVFFKDPRNNYLLKGFTESGDIDGKKIKGKISNFIKFLTGPEISRFNRYRRGLKFVHRRIRPKVDTLFSSLFSDASDRRV